MRNAVYWEFISGNYIIRNKSYENYIRLRKNEEETNGNSAATYPGLVKYFSNFRHV